MSIIKTFEIGKEYEAGLSGYSNGGANKVECINLTPKFVTLKGLLGVKRIKITNYDITCETATYGNDIIKAKEEI